MARKPKAENNATDNRSKLIEALRFAAFVSTGHDNEEFNYIKIKDGLLTGADDVIVMGMPVDADLDLCIHSGKFKAALEQCKENFHIAQISGSAISVREERFRALIPTMASDQLPDYLPDAACCAIDDRIKAALEICNSVVGLNKDDNRLYALCALLRSNTCVATNGHVAFEYWHGIHLPPNLRIPERAIKAICKQKKHLTGLGFSEFSVTFYYEDGSFIKTRQQDINYPDVDAIFNNVANDQTMPLPVDFYAGLDAISGFVENNAVRFHANCLATELSLELGANFKVEGLPGNLSFDLRYLQIIRPYVKTIAFIPPSPDSLKTQRPSIFYGDSLRGLICGRSNT